jgi:hypothetical protein
LVILLFAPWLMRSVRCYAERVHVVLGLGLSVLAGTRQIRTLHGLAGRRGFVRRASASDARICQRQAFRRVRRCQIPRPHPTRCRRQPPWRSQFRARQVFRMLILRARDFGHRCIRVFRRVLGIRRSDLFSWFFFFGRRRFSFLRSAKYSCERARCFRRGLYPLPLRVGHSPTSRLFGPSTHRGTPAGK